MISSRSSHLAQKIAGFSPTRYLISRRDIP